MSQQPTQAQQSRKAMVFDVDKSLSTIGSVERQEEIFGVRPVGLVGGIDRLNNHLDKLLQVIETPIEHPLLGEIGSELSIAFNEKAQQMGLNTLIVDSLSVLGMQERSAIKKEEKLKSMDRQAWGLYGDKMLKFINKLSKCEFSVVCTSHAKRDSDENGIPIEIPDLKGSSATECARFFEVVAYSHVSKDASGNAEYSWIVNADPRHKMAKNRKGILGTGKIPQDLSYIYERYAAHGMDNPNILIIADSGNGKSWSLQTLNGPEYSEEAKALIAESEAA